MSYINKLTIAREFRNNPTRAENILWNAIKRDQILGYRFRRQYIVAGFIIDFYCPKLRLGIEVDGEIHNLDDNRIRDLERENIISQYNINIIRFTNKEIKDNILTVLNNLKAKIKNIEQKNYI
mgnify:CR=1 FL=1